MPPMPPMPPPGGIPAAPLGSGLSATIASVVIKSPATEAASCNATRTKSLVAAEVDGTIARYRLLDTTRAYALEKLGESGEREQFARRHAEYYRDLFESAETEWDTRPTAEWLADYGRQIDDLRAALDWAFSPSCGRAPLVSIVIGGRVPWMGRTGARRP